MKNSKMYLAVLTQYRSATNSRTNIVATTYSALHTELHCENVACCTMMTEISLVD